jgi:hypothetical protein
METPVSVLERHFNLTALDDDAVDYLASRSWEDWHEFSWLYTEQYAQHFLGLNQEELTKREGELSPYLFEYFSYDDALWVPRNDAARDADKVLHNLKRLLLFHHRVFAPDWFLWLLDYIRCGSPKSEDALLHLALITEYVGVLRKLKPLFDDGIINFIPTEALVTRPIVAGRFDVPVDPEWIGAETSKYSKDPGFIESLAKDILNRIFIYLENATTLGVDVILPNRKMSSLFDAAVTSIVRPQVQFAETLPMPGLDRLRIEDLVMLRRNDEDFERWRNELRQIYQIARIDNELLEKHPQDFAADAAARLRHRRDAIKAGAAAHGFAGTIQSKTITLGLGLFGTFAANLVIPGGGLAVSLLGAFLGGSAGMGLDTVKHIAGRKKREALVRLYSVFDAS